MIHLKIITPKGLFLEDDIESINVKTVEGYRTILSNHIPLVAMLDICKCTTKTKHKTLEYALASGLLQMNDNEMHILSDAVEEKSEIDIERSKQALARAKERLEKREEDLDIKRAEVALAKAINRIHIQEEH